MKVIYPDYISSVTADEEDANYLAVNLQDDHPKKVWKGTSRDAVVTIVASAGGALAIIATNATSVTIVLSVGQSISWDTGISWNTSGDDDTTETTLLTGDTDGVIWSDFDTARTSNFTATITLTADAGEIIQAGVIRCGTANIYADPSPGVREGLRDYSIVKELNNGATYFRKRDVVRDFEFSIIEDRDVDFYEFMIDVSKAAGPEPLAWRIVDGATDAEWIVFARFDSMPRGSHVTSIMSQIDINLLEVL